MFKKPSEIIFSLGMKCGFPFLDDVTYLKLMYRCRFGRKLDLNNPKLYTEKLQWLKINDFNPAYTKMVDKLEVKKYISNIFGDDYIIPTLGVWKSFDEIDFDRLPNQFVLKCTHDSGSVVICYDKNTFDFKKAKNKLNRCLKRNYYWVGREKPYYNVNPQIIAENYLYEDSICNDENVLTDYKFFCFSGKPKIMYISKDKSEVPTTDFFDMDFNHLDIKMRDPNADTIPQKPLEFEKMKTIATILSKNFKHLRVDFYVVNKKIYIGELTFYHNSGFSEVQPLEWSYKLASWI